MHMYHSEKKLGEKTIGGKVSVELEVICIKDED